MDTLKRVGQFVASIAISFAAAGAGSFVTVKNIPTWYEGLDKPPLLPPNEVFGPVWGVLYLLMGIALFLVWVNKKSDKGLAYVAFFSQLILNVTWSWVFFGFHLPWLACVVIILLIAAIIWTMRTFYRVSRGSVWLLAPYLVWVLFASYLTFGVAVLN